MTISFSLDTAGVNVILEGFPGSDIRRALQDAAQILINSTHAGYLKQRSPEGDKWQANIPWYSAAKGGAAVLTGPTSRAVAGGAFAGYEFAQINPKRMRNSLISKVEGSERAIVEYDQQASERAAITQAGGPSKLNLISPMGTAVEIDLTIMARPHLGLAENYTRLGGMTDPEHIVQIFDALIDGRLG